MLSIHGVQNRRWGNIEIVTINNSVRLLKMTDRYLYCRLKHAVNILERTNSTWCWSSNLKKDLGANFGSVTILQPWARRPSNTPTSPNMWKKGRTAGTASWCKPAKLQLHETWGQVMKSDGGLLIGEEWDLVIRELWGLLNGELLGLLVGEQQHGNGYYSRNFRQSI